MRAGELALPDGVTLLDDPESVIATVTHQMREEELEPTAEGEEGAAEAEGSSDASAEAGAGGDGD